MLELSSRDPFKRLASPKDIRLRTVPGYGRSTLRALLIRGRDAGKDVKRKGVDVSEVSTLPTVSIVVSNKVLLAAVAAVPKDCLEGFLVANPHGGVAPYGSISVSVVGPKETKPPAAAKACSAGGRFAPLGVRPEFDRVKDEPRGVVGGTLRIGDRR
jgi:hypothetical protein